MVKSLRETLPEQRIHLFMAASRAFFFFFGSALSRLGRSLSKSTILKAQTEAHMEHICRCL